MTLPESGDSAVLPESEDYYCLWVSGFFRFLLSLSRCFFPLLCFSSSLFLFVRFVVVL